jgi:hypothetical protein
MISRSNIQWIITVLCIILAQTVILFVLLPQLNDRFGRFYGEYQFADGYDQLAANLSEGHGYRFYPETAQTLLREPGYPLLLAGLFSVFGKDFWAVTLTNMFLALTAGYILTRIGKTLSSSRVLIFGAPLLFLFHPATLIAESRGGVEILFTFLLTLYVFTLYRAIRSGDWQDYLWSGLVLGLAVLVRSTPILFPLVVAGYLFVFRPGLCKTAAILRNCAIMTAAMVIVLSPWIIRNYSLTEKFVPTASVLGVSAQTGFYLASHDAVGNVQIDREAALERSRLAHELGYHFKDGYYQYFYSSADEVKFSHFLLIRTVRAYAASPLLFAKTVVLNFFKFWCGGKTSESVTMNAILQLPIVALAVVAIVLCFRDHRLKEVAPMPLLAIYLMAVSIPILAQARYSQPLLPFVSLLAGVTLITAQRKLQGASHPDMHSGPIIRDFA